MKIENYKVPKSSFFSVNKDLSIIVDWMLKNKNLKKLLYYTSKDALKREPLSEEESLKLINKNIKIVPKIYIDKEVLTYVIIGMDNFVTNGENPQFRDNVITFDIICHFDQWPLEDFDLRPYRIAAEIDSMLAEIKLTGIGRTEFLGCNQLVLSDEFAGLTLMYYVYHGGEDKKIAPNPEKEESFIEDFNELFNNSK